MQCDEGCISQLVGKTNALCLQGQTNQPLSVLEVEIFNHWVNTETQLPPTNL